MLDSAFFCFYDFSNFFLFGFLFREESVLIVEKSVKLFFFFFWVGVVLNYFGPYVRV